MSISYWIFFSPNLLDYKVNFNTGLFFFSFSSLLSNLHFRNRSRNTHSLCSDCFSLACLLASKRNIVTEL